jgi:hypothetical protein
LRATGESAIAITSSASARTSRRFIGQLRPEAALRADRSTMPRRLPTVSHQEARRRREQCAR